MSAGVPAAVDMKVPAVLSTSRVLTMFVLPEAARSGVT